MKTSTRRLLLAGAAAAVLLAAGYLVAVNAYLRSRSLARALDRHPDHFFVRYASAWTVWPGVVHLRQLELHGQSRTVQWWVGIDDATIAIDLPRLLGRELVASSLDASGIAFRLRRRPEAVAGSAPPAQTPPIPGLLNTPAPPERPAPAGGAASWRIRLGGVSLRRLAEVWIGAYRFTGDANAAGGFDLHLDRSFALDPATVVFRSGSLLLASRPLLDGVAGGGRFELPAFDPNHLQGGFLRLASGNLVLHGRLEGLGFLEPYLHEVPWIGLGGSAGTVEADLRVARGTYLPGTHVEARPGRVTATLLEDQASGSCEVSWDVARDGGGAMGRLVAAFDEFQLRRLGAVSPRAHGRGLRVEIGTRDLRIDALPAPATLAVDLPPTAVGDFSSYNANLPQGAGIAVRSGTGILRASLRAAAPAWEATGGIDLRGTAVVVDVQGARLRGNLSARSRFRALPQQRQLLLTESSVEIADVVRLGAGGGPPRPGWWARLHLDYLAVRPGALIVLRARLQSTLSDTRPLFALFAPQPRPVVSWLDRLLDLHPIGAVGELAAGDGYFSVESLTVNSGSADIRARLRFAGGHTDGILYAAYGPLSAGMELRGGRRSWKLVRARRWFENHPGLAPPAARAR
jgi:hypothetical protein